MIPKFRAWDEENREMLEVHGISFDVQGIWTKELIDDESDGNFIFLSDVELLQSTGLKDKDGMEIFEGDVISCFSEGLSVVEYRYGGFGLVFNEYFESFANVLGGVEVLGNKYEHSHLLKEE